MEYYNVRRPQNLKKILVDSDVKSMRKIFFKLCGLVTICTLTPSITDIYSALTLHKRLDLNKRGGLTDFFIARHDIQRFVVVFFFITRKR